MTTLETLAVVFAVYAVVFLAHRATQVLEHGEPTDRTSPSDGPVVR